MQALFIAKFVEHNAWNRVPYLIDTMKAKINWSKMEMACHHCNLNQTKLPMTCFLFDSMRKKEYLTKIDLNYTLNCPWIFSPQTQDIAIYKKTVLNSRWNAIYISKSTNGEVHPRLKCFRINGTQKGVHVKICQFLVFVVITFDWNKKNF